jgi:hypothetical protein
MDNNTNYKERNRIIGGLILVLVGGGLLLRNLDFPMPHWLFTWPMILILVGLYTGIKHNFQNSSWIILIALGTIFIIQGNFYHEGIRPFLWPALIIGIGLMFILSPRKKKLTDSFEKTNSFETTNSNTTMFSDGSVVDESDFLSVSSVFSGVKRIVLSKNFQGGKISCVFGGVDIDFLQADINGKAVLRMEEVFGGIKLRVPAHWAIQNEIDGVFHGVDDKRKNFTNITTQSEKVLVLKGSAVFAGIEITSY